MRLFNIGRRRHSAVGACWSCGERKDATDFWNHPIYVATSGTTCSKCGEARSLNPLEAIFFLRDAVASQRAHEAGETGSYATAMAMASEFDAGRVTLSLAEAEALARSYGDVEGERYKAPAFILVTRGTRTVIPFMTWLRFRTRLDDGRISLCQHGMGLDEWRQSSLEAFWREREWQARKARIRARLRKRFCKRIGPGGGLLSD